jgi:sulfite oxidase
MWGKREDMIVHQAEPYNAESPRPALVGRLLTPMEAFFVRSHGPVPCVHPDAWRLRIGGLVERPLMLSLERLRTGFQHREIVATLQCAGNRRAALTAVRDVPGHAPWAAGAISTARWTGVSLADVLAAAGPLPRARHVALSAPDVAVCAQPPQRFGCSIPLAKAAGREVLLAWAMNGEPLPSVHGGPVRLVVPGFIGARSVKWIDRVILQDRPSDDYFQAVAYRLLPPGTDPGAYGTGEELQLGPVAVNADILHPGDGATLPAGPTMVSGYALGGHDREVARVDVSIDQGRTWRQAALDPSAGVWAWRHWHVMVDLPAGSGVEIAARAWDTAASVQPESAAALWNPGGYVNNAWARVRVNTV